MKAAVNWEKKATFDSAGREGMTADPDGAISDGYRDYYYGNAFMGAERMGVAALALHSQPFGFTWEDVKELQGISDNPDLPTITWRLDSMIKRISALLPPEGAT